jgi:hypothetical protein
MAAYSGFCEAPLVFLFYQNIFPRIFGGSRTFATIFQMLVVENLFLWPLLIYPTYYMMEAVGDPKKINKMRSGDTIHSASTADKTNIVDDVAYNLSRYKADWWAVNLASMQVWIPANFINFRFMPTNLRTPFMGVCAFGYTTYWSIQQAELRRRTASVPSVKDALKAEVDLANERVVKLGCEEQDLRNKLQLTKVQKAQAELDLVQRQEAYQAVLIAPMGGSLHSNVTARAASE